MTQLACCIPYPLSIRAQQSALFLAVALPQVALVAHAYTLMLTSRAELAGHRAERPTVWPGGLLHSASVAGSTTRPFR